MKKRIVCQLFLVLLSVFWIISCSQPKVKTEPTPDYEDAYKNELKRWTRTKKVYRGLETTFIAHVTFKSPSMRQAYLDNYAFIYQISDDRREKMASDDEVLAERYLEFILALFTPDNKHNNLDEVSSTWKIYLSNNVGDKIVPYEITELRKSPLIQGFYPYVNAWNKAYRIRFFNKGKSKSEEPLIREEMNQLTLTLAGVLGEAQFTWSADYQELTK